MLKNYLIRSIYREKREKKNRLKNLKEDFLKQYPLFIYSTKVSRYWVFHTIKRIFIRVMAIIAFVSDVASGQNAYVFNVWKELRASNKIKCTFQNLFL